MLPRPPSGSHGAVVSRRLGAVATRGHCPAFIRNAAGPFTAGSFDASVCRLNNRSIHLVNPLHHHLFGCFHSFVKILFTSISELFGAPLTCVPGTDASQAPPQPQLRAGGEQRPGEQSGGF